MTPKYAQWDLTELTDQLRAFGSNAGARISGMGNAVGNWYNNFSRNNPELKNTLLRGLLGAGTGATALGLSHALSARDPDERSDWKQKALLGALLGGGAAIALPAGIRMLQGQIKAPGESGAGLLESGVGGVLGGAVSNPAMVAGGTLGGLATARKYRGLLGGPTLKGPSAKGVWDLLQQRLKEPGSDVPGILRRAGMSPSATMSQMGAAGQDTLRKIVGGTVVRGKYHGGLQPGVQYSTFFNNLKTPDFLRKIPHMPKTLPLKPVWSAFKNFRDPRVKLIASILGGIGAGALAQKAVKGAV